MRERIRPLTPADVDAVAQLAVRARAPGFASFEQALGPEIFRRLDPTGSAAQGHDVEALLAAGDDHVWVSEADGVVGGFVAVRPEPERHLGVITMLAVDPDLQGRGIGSALVTHALVWIRESGLGVAMVETGAGADHAPARHIYEKAGFFDVSPVRYWLELEPGS